MILEEVLCTMRDRLLDTGYLTRFYEYCELVKDGTVIMPKHYIGKGEYVNVIDFEANGTGYARKNGSTRIAENTNYPLVTSCSTAILDMTYPLRVVLGVPKTKLEDSAYSDDLLFTELLSVVGGVYAATNVSDVKTSVTGYDTDSLSIWAAEVRGQDYQMNFNLTYIAIDFNLTFTVAQNCLAEVCGYGY